MPGYNIFVAVFQGFPESLVLVFLTYALLGLKVVPMRVVALGLLSLTLFSVVRALGAPFPAHSLFSLAMMPVVLCMWENIPLKAAAVGWGVAMGVLLVLESISLWLFVVCGLSPEMLVVQPWRTIIGLPHVVVMAVLALWIHGRRGVRFFKEIRSA